MNGKGTPLQIDLTRWCDMRHEEVRKALDNAERCGAVLSKEEHLALHRSSFAAGARAMAAITHGQLAKMIEQEAEAARITPNVIPFNLEASADRFAEWHTGGTPQPLPESGR